MVDEDYFDDFNRRRPRRQTYRGSYRNPGSSQFFDPSADILAGIESVEKTIGERKTTVRDFENAAAVRRQETLDSLRETEGMSDTTAIDSLQQQLMNEVDELYKLDIASFEGDRSAYLKKAGEVNKIVETIPALMGLIDAEGETLKENQSSSQDFFKKLLRSNDPNYYDFVDAASKGGPGVSFRTQNGNIIAQLNGKDIFNGNAYVKAKKDGFDLVKYAGDYTPQINEADTLASKGLDSLVSKETTEKVNKGIELVGEEKTNYTLAKQKYEERLRSGNIPIPVNESTYQMFTNYGISDSDKKDPWGKDLQMQEGATREAVVQYMIDQKFPGGDKVTTKTTTKEIQGPTAFEREKLALQKRKLGLEELKLGREIEKELAPKFQNQLEQEYSKEETNKFINARRKYKGIKIAMDQIVDSMDLTPMPSLAGMKQEERNETRDRIREQNSKVLIKEEDLKKLFKSYPSIEMPAYEEINTPSKLENVLMTVVLGQDPNLKGFDRDKYNIMNRDYENFLKEQDKVSNSKVKLSDAELIKNAKPGDEITLSDGRVIRKK